jgi:hypothetical protein
MKQTAVEWLWDALDNILELYPSEWEKISKAVEQAKEMEREHVVEAYASGLKRGAEFERRYQSKILQDWPNEFEYYDQTFNTDEK